MATDSSSMVLAERADIHKSCRSLEVLLNVLNDYCEAAGAVIVLQKKLAKALRETAGLKITGEIATGAMNASAAIFEASSDIDSKFAKIMDKEYDGISAEVKKWFKKLAKEEKAHDEKMSNANARIKQAGQMYEKKSKKSLRDATEEHNRYINLITSLGPEISQEKYNHTLNVTQRHALTTYSTAACLSRIADAGWLRVCECVRRFSPTIGQLGEWRALCEGGWVGPIPPDLPDLDEGQQPQPDHEVTGEVRREDADMPTTLGNIETTEVIHRSSNEVEQTQDYPLPNRNLPLLPRKNQPYASPYSNSQEHLLSTGPSSFEPPRPLVDPQTGSVRSLSAFPSPPTHFPLPPLRQQQASRSQSSQTSSQGNLSAAPRLAESPLPIESREDSSLQPHQDNSSHSFHTPPSKGLQEESDTFNVSDAAAPVGDMTRPVFARSEALNSAVAAPNLTIETPAVFSDTPPAEQTIRPDNVSELGVNVRHETKVRTVGIARTQAVERSGSSTGGDNSSNSNIVAAMRNHYSNLSGTASPVSKDVPRLPLSVTDLATRYQPKDSSSSPPIRSSSISRQALLSPIDTQMAQDRHQLGDRGTMPSVVPTPDNEAARHRRQQRIDDLAGLELKEKELEIRERERDIEMRARELEKDRAHLMDMQVANQGNDSREIITSQPQMQLRPRERKFSFRQQRPQSQLEISPSSPSLSNTGRLQSQRSYSIPQLVPPSPSTSSTQAAHKVPPPNYGQSYYSHSPSSSRQSTQYPDEQHAPYCGCETCSASKYKITNPSPQPQDLRPPAEPIVLRPVEKSKPGWIRRLSMPVGNAFNLDSKNLKGIGNNPGISGGHQQGRSGIFSLDGKKNVSTTTLITRVQEDGRRSYDAVAVANRSMTNLGRR